MSRNSSFSAIDQNLTATQALFQHKKRIAMHKNMCWKCQKEKSLKNGKVKFFGAGAPRMFICADCVAARKQA